MKDGEAGLQEIISRGSLRGKMALASACLSLSQLGDDHPHTLQSANSLAGDLRRLGEVQAALQLDQDTLNRNRRVLGDDHPNTRLSFANLAEDLRALGDVNSA